MFDIRQAAIPFAMRPGLERLTSGARHFHPLAKASQLAEEKRQAWKRANALLISPSFFEDVRDRALGWVRQSIIAQAQADAISLEAVTATKRWADCQEHLRPDGRPAWQDTRAFFEAFSLSVEEDIAVLDGRPSSPHRAGLPLLCVTCPSHWAPEDKIGLALAEVHGPIADNSLLVKASEALVSLATRGEHWQRWVWTITPSPHFDAHPFHDASPERRRVWPAATLAADAYLQACHLRSERQTFFPVVDDFGEPSGLAVFTIQVQLTPVQAALPTKAHTLALRDSLASMSEAVLQYKGLLTAQVPLLHALEHQARTQPDT